MTTSQPIQQGTAIVGGGVTGFALRDSVPDGRGGFVTEIQIGGRTDAANARVTERVGIIHHAVVDSLIACGAGTQGMRTSERLDAVTCQACRDAWLRREHRLNDINDSIG